MFKVLLYLSDLYKQPYTLIWHITPKKNLRLVIEAKRDSVEI